MAPPADDRAVAHDEPTAVRPAAASLVFVVLWGCAHRPAPDRPATGVLPPAFSSEEGAAAPDRWWRSFGDPGLDEWIERSLAGNLSIARAWARLEQARRAAEAAGAERAPSLSVEGSARRGRSVATIPARGTVATTASQFALGLATAYEVDLWGRVSAGIRAAAEEWTATRLDLETAAMTLAAETAEAWMALREQIALRRLLETQLAASREYVRLVEHRFGQGLASALDVYQQRQQAAGVAALVPPVEARFEVLRHQLAVLAGRPPSHAPAPPAEGLVDPPPTPAAGLPADLLRRRPDVAAAQARLRAADERLAAAVANRLPTLRLSAGAGTQSAEWSRMFDEWFWNLSGALVGPLLDGGRRRSEAERARAARDESWLAWRQTVLQAVREVEDALVQEWRQAETVRRLEEQRAAAARTLEQARVAYINGQAEYLSVLTALDRFQQAERTLVSARRQWWSHRIQLHRALGGGWTAELAPPAHPAAPTEADG